MSIRVMQLRDFTYNNHEFDILWVILDEHSSPLLLPLLYTTHLSLFGFVYKSIELSDETQRKRFRELVPNSISTNTIRAYVYCLEEFLNHLEDCKSKHQTPGAHFSSTCSERFVNHYLNEVLAASLASTQSLEAHRSALMAYFNWLNYSELGPRLNLRVYRKTRKTIAENSTKQHYIQYVSRYWRSRLLNSCTTLAQKLMLRMGFEVGLRTSELMGLRLTGKNDLRNLFNELDCTDSDHTERFRYWLHGTYAKGEKSRWIYFSRQLLIDMKRYFHTERQWLANQTGIEDSSFFLRTDPRFKGTGIKEHQGTRVFGQVSQLVGLNPLIEFHDLRHTFATELYHAELEGPDGRETRSESAALIVVAQRLGHTFTKDGHAPAVTTKYIRMRLQMVEIENE